MPGAVLSEHSILPTLLTAASVAIACAVLSVFVVSRRWAFIGEGISHSGLGGAGTAWMLALAWPALDRPWLPYAGVIGFCLATAVAIGYFTRRGRANADAVIGIFMVASVAWGALAQSIYHARRHASPPDWTTFFQGDMTAPTLRFGIAAALACAAVVVTVALLRKEILYYCFDPAMAEASGVRAGFVHYLLLLLVTVTIVIGTRVAGSLLVTALLILPGSTALVLSERLRASLVVAVGAGLFGAAAGLALHAKWVFLPMGPSIVLSMFALFVATYAFARATRGRAG
jgi:ABC-type Mn2+/Zn2+ transport system permease subunit